MSRVYEKKRRIPLIFFFYGELQLQETGAGKNTALCGAVF